MSDFPLSRRSDMMDFLCKICTISALLSVSSIGNAHIGGAEYGFLGTTKVLCMQLVHSPSTDTRKEPHG